jgi:RNA polymerase sigma factor (sigma-70 family)
MASAVPAIWQPQRGRTAALAEGLYASHHARLLAIARRNSVCIEDAEEALQDTFILFIDHYEPDSEAPPLAWLTLTLKRRCWAIYHHQRLRAAVRRVGGAEGLPDRNRLPDEMAEVNETVARMRHQFEALKPAEREALGLLAFGYTYNEICQLTGWTYTKVNRCISEGRAALRSTQRPAG